MGLGEAERDEEETMNEKFDAGEMMQLKIDHMDRKHRGPMDGRGDCLFYIAGVLRGFQSTTVIEKIRSFLNIVAPSFGNGEPYTPYLIEKFIAHLNGEVVRKEDF